jgi:polar amino acid transport system substrate-binding protein
MLIDVSRRSLAFAVAAAAGVATGAPALAQGASGSTWDQIISRKVLRVGAAQAEPWYFKDTSGSSAPGSIKSGDATWRGVGALMGKELADAMGVQLELVETTWGNAVAGLQANQFDVMFLLDGTPQRAVAIDFVPRPLLWYPIVVLVKDGVDISTWHDTNDAKYNWGAPLGTSLDQFITKAAPKATISRFQNNSEVVAAFQAGRVDGIVATGPFADLSRARVRMGRTIIPKPAGALAAGSGIRYEPDHRWKSFLTTCLEYFYNSGKTQELFDSFLAFRGLDPLSVIPIQRERWS